MLPHPCVYFESHRPADSVIADGYLGPPRHKAPTQQTYVSYRLVSPTSISRSVFPPPCHLPRAGASETKRTPRARSDDFLSARRHFHEQSNISASRAAGRPDPDGTPETRRQFFSHLGVPSFTCRALFHFGGRRDLTLDGVFDPSARDSCGRFRSDETAVRPFTVLPLWVSVEPNVRDIFSKRAGAARTCAP